MRRLKMNTGLGGDFAEAFNEVCATLDRVGISISVEGHRTFVTFQGRRFDLADSEDEDCPVDVFPPVTEVALYLEED